MRGGALLLAAVLAAVFVQPANAVYHDPAVRKEFQKKHPCPANGKRSGPCPGWIVDHIVPCARAAQTR